MKLDKIDLKILAALQIDGRMTKLRLAEAVNLSPTACWERLDKLEKSGVITGYTARINRDKFGRGRRFSSKSCSKAISSRIFSALKQRS